MTGRDVTASFASTLVDEWVRSGLTHAVVSPGSRNTPLVLALARDGRLRVDVVLDERSAAFRALGVGLASGRPAIVCCTSGTAAANMHPAVIEAHHARVPLLVCTADRPPELRDWGRARTRRSGTASRQRPGGRCWPTRYRSCAPTRRRCRRTRHCSAARNSRVLTVRSS